MDLQALITSVAKYGVAAVLLSFLVYEMGTTLPEIQAQHVLMMERIEANGERISSIITSSEARDYRQLQILRAICLILAANQKEINLCNPQ